MSSSHCPLTNCIDPWQFNNWNMLENVVEFPFNFHKVLEFWKIWTRTYKNIFLLWLGPKSMTTSKGNWTFLCTSNSSPTLAVPKLEAWIGLVVVDIVIKGSKTFTKTFWKEMLELKVWWQFQLIYDNTKWKAPFLKFWEFEPFQELPSQNY